MEQADRHPEDDLLERERDKLRDELAQARQDAERYRESLERLSEYAIDAVRAPSEQPVDVPELEEQGKLRDELTQARQDAERDRSSLEATYKRQQALEKDRDTLLYLFHEAKEAAERRLKLLRKVEFVRMDTDVRGAEKRCPVCYGYQEPNKHHTKDCALAIELHDAESEAPSCPACDTPTPDGEPCLACAEYAIDSVRAPSDVPKMPEFCDSKEYFRALDAAVRWLIEQERGRI